MTELRTVEINRELDEDTEITIEVEYDYSPEEPMVRYYRDGSGYPGCPAMVELCEARRTDTGEVVELTEAEAEDAEQKAFEAEAERSRWEADARACRRCRGRNCDTCPV
jgi:hypothetical protein